MQQAENHKQLNTIAFSLSKLSCYCQKAAANHWN